MLSVVESDVKKNLERYSKLGFVVIDDHRDHSDYTILFSQLSLSTSGCSPGDLYLVPGFYGRAG